MIGVFGYKMVLFLPVGGWSVWFEVRSSGSSSVFLVSVKLIFGSIYSNNVFFDSPERQLLAQRHSGC